MKKYLFAFAVIAACLSSKDVMAGDYGFYAYTGCAFASTGMTIDQRIEEQTTMYVTGPYTTRTRGEGYSLYSSNEKYISLGVGYRFESGLGLEIGVMDDVAYSAFRELDGDVKNEGKTYNEALVAGLYKSSAINNNLNLIVALSYRHLILEGKSYHDVLVEPLCMEYMTNNRHWGFRLSLFSLEALTRTAKEEQNGQNSQNSFDNSLGTITTGLNFNSFPIKVCYYF